jgi:hypothetical protein
MLWGSMGADRGVVRQRPRHHRDDVTLVAKSHITAHAGQEQGWCLGPPGPSCIIDRPIPAAS